MPRKQEGADSVDAFLEGHKHPLRETAQALVSRIRKIDSSLEEGIKWNAPSFKHQGDDRLTLNLSAKDRIRLILHCGAKAGPKRKSKLIESDSQLLEWAGNDRAIINFDSVDAVHDARKDLESIIKAWLAASAP